MRVTISSGIDTITLPRIQGGVRWELLADGLEGWFEPPENRAEVSPVDGGVGGLWPHDLFQPTSRVVTLRLGYLGNDDSTAVQARRRVVALYGRPLTITVLDDDGQELSAQGYLEAQPKLSYVTSKAAKWSLIVVFPDPVRYGPAVDFSGSTIVNTGDAPVRPAQIVTTGNVTRIAVVIDGHYVTWAGATSGVVIDLHTGIARAGSADVSAGVRRDDVPLLSPGSHSLSINTDASSAAVRIRPGWL